MTKYKTERVAIVGAGNQGSKIAFRCAVSGLETMVYDKFSKAISNAEKCILEFSNEHLQRNIKSRPMQKLRFAKSLAACCKNADLIIEAVPENLEIKRQVWAEINEVAPAGAFLCTNSSSIVCSKISGSINSPEKMFNINFSDPVHDDLVQIMKGAMTADDTLEAGVDFIRSLGMVPIVTYREIMGFSFNRVWRAIKRECLHLVDKGYSDAEDLDRAWILQFQMEYGPFGLMDIIGLDVIRDIEEQYYIESGEERDIPPKFLGNMVNQGKLGVKTGQGFYKYPNPEYKEKEWLRKEGKYQENIAKKLINDTQP